MKRFHLSEEARREQSGREEQQLKHYQLLTEQVLKGKQSALYNATMFDKTSELLNVNPEFYTVWNYRRDIITNHYRETLTIDELAQFFDKELIFNMTKFQKFPKVYWIWSHRVWLLENHPNVNWPNELAMVEKIHKLDPRNFHGWTYRRYIIKQMEKTQDLTLQEFDYTTKMINNNFSNFSALHNRTKLIPLLFERRLIKESPLDFLRKELEYLHNALFTDPEDQSVFIYLRWVLTCKVFTGGITQDEYLTILKGELDIVDELNELEKEDGKENSWCLKTIVSIRQLISGITGEQDNEIRNCLELLVKVDPLRKDRYVDLIKQEVL